ncbi:MAG: type II toxin-antitoxin system prevent-host-death family antitoxin [Sulfuricellaceae bacterium]
MQISIRELKVNPSYYIQQAETGHSVWVTSHKRVVARLVSATPPEALFGLGNLANVSWNGKKPKGGKLRPILPGETLADTVLEMR